MVKLDPEGLSNLIYLSTKIQGNQENIEELDEELKVNLVKSIKEDSKGNTIYITLSGGIDSSLIAGIAGLELRKRIVAYTICDSNSPDLKFAEIMVNYLRNEGVNIKWIKRPLTEDEQNVDYESLERKLNIEVERLRGNRKSWPVLYGWLRKLISPNRRLFKIITGDGGDELGGYAVCQNPVLVKEQPHYLLISPKDEEEREIIKKMKSGDKTACLDYYRKIALDSLFLPEAKYANHFGFDPYCPYLNKKVIDTILKYNVTHLIDTSSVKKPFKRIAMRYGYVPKQIINRKKCGLGKSIRPQWEKNERD